MAAPLRPPATPANPATAAPTAAPGLTTLPPHVAALRQRGAAGGIIAQHRALKRIRVSRGERGAAVALAAAFLVAWVLVLPLVARAWRAAFALWGPALGLPGGVTVTHYDGGPLLPALDLPTLAAAAPGAPTTLVWWVTAIVTVLALVGSLFLPERATPFAYLLRAVGALQASALVYMAVRSAGLPYELPAYVQTLLWGGIGVIALVPVVYGFTYYIFDFGFARKAALTAATMLHLSVLLPLQCLVHAYVLHRLSQLFLPLLFVMFGLLLEVMALVAFYAWGMSWREVAEPEYAPPSAPSGVTALGGGGGGPRRTSGMLRWVVQRSRRRAPSPHVD